ncbi:MAG: MarR family transcriptional regulator [Alphaproteobacteria bacterium]|nr:MarR family transcriptional regulator [Alphaproteobacteria bacterium]
MNTPLQNLSVWQKAVLENVQSADAPDLSERQMAILLTVYLKPYPHTVKSLSELLIISKPPVTRALDTLASYGFIKRQPDRKDKRKVLIMRTVKGAEFLSKFAGIIGKAEQGI